MLEYNFTEMDDDFITLWSQYLLFEDTSMVICPLEQLAENGQINAIQCWYLLKQQDAFNEKIDNIVDSYGDGGSFNESLAIANRTLSQTKFEIQPMIEEYNNCLRTYESNPCRSTEEKLIECENRLKSTQYGSEIRRAYAQTLSVASNIRSALVWERVLELCASRYPFMDTELDFKGFSARIQKVMNKVDRKLSSTEQFVLGKNLFIFGSNSRKRYKGTEILRDLANRPLKTVQQNAQKQGVQDESIMGDE